MPGARFWRRAFCPASAPKWRKFAGKKGWCMRARCGFWSPRASASNPCADTSAAAAAASTSILPHSAQIAAKVEILRETLRRLGQVKWEEPIPAHSGPAWNYRNQAQLKVGKPPDGAPALGFFEAESNRLIPIDACPILSPRLNALLAVLRSEPWIKRTGERSRGGASGR